MILVEQSYRHMIGRNGTLGVYPFLAKENAFSYRSLLIRPIKYMWSDFHWHMGSGSDAILKGRSFAHCEFHVTILYEIFRSVKTHFKSYSGATKKNQTSGLRRTKSALYQLSYSSVITGGVGGDRTLKALITLAAFRMRSHRQPNWVATPKLLYLMERRKNVRATHLFTGQRRMQVVTAGQIIHVRFVLRLSTIMTSQPPSNRSMKNPMIHQRMKMIQKSVIDIPLRIYRQVRYPR